MKLIKPHNVLVCLVFLLMILKLDASAWYFKEAAFVSNQPQTTASQTSETKEISKVKEKKIVKCRPSQQQGYTVVSPAQLYSPNCMLPVARTRGWELDAQAMFARSKGKVRFFSGPYGYAYTSTFLTDLDMNSDLGLPEHKWVGSFSAKYGFRPRWSLRYSIMPTTLEGMAAQNTNINFGYTIASFGANTKVKWERLYQRIGLGYDPINTPSLRVSVFGDYVRLNEKLSVVQVGCCGSTFDNDLNMAMAGVEVQRCLKTTNLFNTLSLECKAGIAFGDDAVGSDLATALRYSIPMNNGRWGFVKGGYRYLTYKKKYSDIKMMETAMDGGFLEAGFIF
ncbi:MAG: hypothetical protein WCG29_05285 [Desulfomonile sp.]|nr:hypothetical protein [Deltaproteobacteria bacterium]